MSQKSIRTLPSLQYQQGALTQFSETAGIILADLSAMPRVLTTEGTHSPSRRVIGVFRDVLNAKSRASFNVLIVIGIAMDISALSLRGEQLKF